MEEDVCKGVLEVRKKTAYCTGRDRNVDGNGAL